ncbi:hypothetical protein H4219_000175 [Mycoemilia scoparia]|uniref:Exportin-1/Importin-beta-like domain-containing protein n=1 Tax=Mycoemilia scoparia TaxID=417184 RepID=A0A9W8DTI8_9FUNG|nr:hypothetical protein H4219_000175 [Mycoemilia scoparia]
MDDESKIQLRDELLSLLKRFVGGPVTVFRKLSQATITCARHMVPDLWNNIALEIIRALNEMGQSGQIDNAVASEAILEFLSISGDDVLRPGGGYTDKLKEDFNSNIGELITILATYLRADSEPTKIQKKAWNALASLVRFQIEFDSTFKDIFNFTIKRIQFLSSAKASTKAGTTQVDVSACNSEIESAIAVLEELLSHTISVLKYKHTVGLLFLEGISTEWVAAEIKSCIVLDHHDTAKTWLRLLVDFGENYCDLLLKQLSDPKLHYNVIRFWNCMIALTNYPGYFGEDEDLTDQAMVFWYNQQEALSDLEMDVTPSSDAEDDNDSSLEAAGMVTHQQFQQIKNIVKDVYLKVIEVLLNKSTYPKQQDFDEWDNDQKEKFRIYRRDVRDTLMNCYYVLGNDMIKPFVGNIINMIKGLNAENWRSLETFVFSLRSLHEAVDIESCEHLRYILSPEVIDNLIKPIILNPQSPSALSNGFLNLFGSYARWWNFHPEGLSSALSCITSAFEQPQIVQSAALAFQGVCESCSDKLIGVVGEMVSLCVRIIRIGSSVFPHNQLKRVLESIGSVVVNLPPQEQLPHLPNLSNAVSTKLYNSILLFGQTLKTQGTTQEAILDQRNRVLEDLELLASYTRGIQVPDNIEDSALEGDTNEIAQMNQLAELHRHCQQTMGCTLDNIFSSDTIMILVFWAQGSIDSEILDSLLEILHNTIRRGTHPLQLKLSHLIKVTSLLWNNILLITTGLASASGTFNSEAPNGTIPITTLDHLEKPEKLFDTVNQLVRVYSKGREEWQGEAILPLQAQRQLLPLVTRQCVDFGLGLGQNTNQQQAYEMMEQHPSVVASFFGMLNQVLELGKQIWANMDPEMLVMLLCLCVLGPVVSDRFTVLGINRFFTSLATISRDNDPGATPDNPDELAYLSLVKSIYSAIEPTLLETIITAIGGQVPRSRVPLFAELLHSMVKNHPMSSGATLRKLLLERVNFPSPHIGQTEKRQFVDSIIR